MKRNKNGSCVKTAKLCAAAFAVAALCCTAALATGCKGEVGDGSGPSISITVKLPADEGTGQPAPGDAGQSAVQQVVELAVDATVDPEFKQVMDDYEAFMMGYCDLLERQVSGTATYEDLAAMASLIEQEVAWMERIDAIDENTLSIADLAYYTEVTLRVSQRLIEVSA